MNTKEFATIAISSIALIVSVLSYYNTVRQRRLDNERALRNSLTDVIAELTQIDLDRVKLDRDNPGMKDDNVVSLRRILNTRRSYLVRHGDYISQQIDNIVTDVDCNVLAYAYSIVGDHQKADSFWKLCIEKSPANVIRAQNLRGYALFLFRVGSFDAGRKVFRESLEVALPDYDQMRRFKADTYAIWMRAERNHGFEDECTRLRESAIAYARRIGSSRDREEFLEYIHHLLPEKTLPDA